MTHQDNKQEILSVTQLSQAIKQQLEARFPTIAVQGEISNLKEQSSGHYYFTLKDAEAQISAVLFKGNARGITRLPKNGDQVVVKGELNVYPPRGYYQIIVRELSYSGVGALLLQLHEMKLQLQQRGWFDKSRKKNLPKYPKTIGVVTSPTGSVIQDIVHILTRRLSGFHLILNPVKVQGEGAADEIAKGIDQFNRFQLADVLIVGRGGGSLEDLWAFNEEKVAAAIFHSDIPIVCAVGHETDYSIADFVADIRAPTPSAAAEIITTEKTHQLHFLSQAKKRLSHTVHMQLNTTKKQLEHFKHQPFLSSPYFFLGPHIQRIDHYKHDILDGVSQILNKWRAELTSIDKRLAIQNPKNQIKMTKDKIFHMERSLKLMLRQQLESHLTRINSTILRTRIDQWLIQRITEKRAKLAQLSSHLKGIDPKNLLAKGFCILLHEKSNAVISSAKQLNADDKARLLMHDGQVSVTINSNLDQL